jgi:glycosyltransferase involved in cell wall biosynthesis
VLNQTYQNQDLEIIVNDDCSTDSTEEIVRAINDERVRFFKNTNNMGAVKNCNEALKHARGRYLKILMQDDVLYPRHIEQSLKVLEENPSVVMTTCQTNVIDSDGKVLMSRKRYKKSRIFGGKDYAVKSLHGRNIFGEPSIMCFRREIYDKGLRYDESFSFNFDWDFDIGLATNGDIAYIAEPLAAFRMSNTSISSNCYIKNKRLIYNESMKLFDKHKSLERLPLTALDRLRFQLCTIVLLTLKMIFVMLTVRFDGKK